MRSTALLPALIFTTSASAWGTLGHNTVALLAGRYLLPETAVWVTDLLPKPQSMVSASTWPDYYAHTPEGRYSAPWHWIDSKDDPPHTCEVNYSRDCKRNEGCIVSAIVNMTARVTDKGLPFDERQMALKFIIHFFGDIHQPLHTENILHGGNGIPVLWGKQHTNLHHVWDTFIPEKYRGGSAIRYAVGWADSLHTEIESGKYAGDHNAWSSCINPATAEKCALVWASGANKWVCDYVLPPTFPEGFNGIDVSGEYYEGAVGIVDALVAMAGWRLAGYLNMIVTGVTGLEDSVRSETIEATMSGDWVKDRYEHHGQTILGGGQEKLIHKFAYGARKTLRRATGWWGNVRIH